jgi:transposase-like protein
MSKGNLTDEERIAAVQDVLNGNGGCKQIAPKYGINHETLRQYVRIAKTEGIDAVKVQKSNRRYSVEIKLQAVKEYLSLKSSLNEICAKYKIRSRSLLQQWISWYNSGKEFKERTRSERRITMNKGRKTTKEERIEIVSFCIENGKNYGLTMEKYGVSYQQIYSWMRKYEEKGVDGLNDRRGKAKPEDKLTEADKLRLENKILQAKLKEMEMENKLLKKLRELRGGDH